MLMGNPDLLSEIRQRRLAAAPVVDVTGEGPPEEFKGDFFKKEDEEEDIFDV